MQVRPEPILTLVVDDSPAALNSICYFLNLRPDIHVVGTAANGREAVIAAQALRPDLVLMDVQMPVMSGIEAASQLIRELPRTRVIMVSVHDLPEVRQACEECGADGFIAKERLDEELPCLLQRIFGEQLSYR